MQKGGQTIGCGVPPTHRWPYEEEQSGSGGGAGGGISQTRLVCYLPQAKQNGCLRKPAHIHDVVILTKVTNNCIGAVIV